MELVPIHKAGKAPRIAEECCDILNHEWPRSRCKMYPLLVQVAHQPFFSECMNSKLFPKGLVILQNLRE